MQEVEVKKILKAAEEACFDSMLDIHNVARRYNTSIIVEIDGIPTEKSPLPDEELCAKQAKIRKS